MTRAMGVMVVACAAMFFAVAGSAFILRARMAHVEAVRAEARARAQHPPVVAPAAPPVDVCGNPEVVQQPDGSKIVVFRTCDPVDDTAKATVLPEDLDLAIPDLP